MKILERKPAFQTINVSFSCLYFLKNKIISKLGRTPVEVLMIRINNNNFGNGLIILQEFVRRLIPEATKNKLRELVLINENLSEEVLYYI
jgi:hypothetical protein